MYNDFENVGTENTYEDKVEKKNKKSGSRKKFLKKSVALILSGALFGAVAGGVSLAVENGSREKSSVIQMEAIDERDVTKAPESSNADVTQVSSNVTYTDVSTVVSNAMPAVVAINCTVVETYNYFGREYTDESTGSGSGIIIGQNASEILIVTNNHVIDGASTVEVVFTDGTTANAEIKGAESSADIAVISVLAADLSDDTLNAIRIASLGDSDSAKEGEMVIAIGNALGYGQAVTVGYISALDREVEVDDIKLNLIQVDAAINPGNSGGALLNIYGQVIGINSVKYASTDVEGIGYAIPISEVISIINDLMNREELSEEEMGYLGISGNGIEKAYSSAYNIPVGLYILKVEEDSPADIAGLVKGDIITAANGKKIEEMSDLQQFLSYTRGGSTVEFTIMSYDRGQYIEKQVEVTLGFRP